MRALKKNVVRKKSEWDNPREGFVHINVDASFNAQNFSG
jgi:hypothetical protein